jgi:flagellar basal body-associated protein FliL
MAEEDAKAEAPKRKLPDPQTLIAVVNTLLALGALGVMVYTKLIYQRPAIVESTEIKKQAELAKTPATPAEPELVSFDQMTVNVAMTSGKAHFATLSFAVQCRDSEAAEAVKNKRPLLVDRVIAALGRRELVELNTIQGKLLLKTELVHQFNEIVPTGDVTDMFFSDFKLQ